MDPRTFLKGLHPLEIKVLLRYAPGDGLDAARLASELGYVEGHANQAQAWLSAKGLAAETGRSSRNVYELTALGREWLEAGSPEEVPGADKIAPDDPFFLLYTGGTTGVSKGALHSHASAAAEMLNQTVAERVVPSDVYMLTGQMYHIPVVL
ncbi:MAG TPA: AMP-binding protein, partial [Spirochaetales bacterium]|nr:AMP-binding protein [Spirochaetales bacterium]